MAYPSFDEIKEAIILVLNQHGGQVRVDTVVQEVTKIFSQLITVDLTRKNTSGVLTWPNRIHLARAQMIRKGILDKNSPGICRLSGTKPPPVPTPVPPVLQDTHQRVIDLIKNIGNILRKDAQGPFGIDYKHDVIWRDNSYKLPSHVWEVCDKGNLDKDIASLTAATDPDKWGSKGFLVVINDNDYDNAKKKLTGKPVKVLKSDTVNKLSDLLQDIDIELIKLILS